MAVLERSINEIVRRHEILRTTFAAVDGRYVQVIAPQLTVPLAFDDLRELPHSEKETIDTRPDSRRSASFLRPRAGPLFGLAWCAWPSRNTSSLIAMHQVICDGWSLGVLVDELVALYDAFSAGEDRRWRRSRSSSRTLRTGSGSWRSHPESLRSLNTGESSFAIRCP